MKRRDFLKILGGAAAGITTLGITGCIGPQNNEKPSITYETLMLTTTTSTYDTGLLDRINGEFEQRYGVNVYAVAQGTGAAIDTAKRGDSDLLLVHARELEDEFLKQGYGVNRRDIMFNDFIIVGPENDPADIKGMENALKAFEKIAETKSTFISRGDNVKDFITSGTHAKELEIWNKLGKNPEGNWYIGTGEGMGYVLNHADNSNDAYTLADRGTYLSMKKNLNLSMLVEGPIGNGSEILSNPYGLIAVNPGRHENVNYDLAMAYIGFITSRKGQKIIEDYTVNGEQLFYPKAISKEPNFQQYIPKGWKP
ncbi:substrate-binding domain-containing protein [Methanonatronarchaeum sp. AMET-Sl]|uniref:substrate-binding domain-containing protein n=1 Tax=Methanonatronarchaeum sp. AMET-Sl TaxID=3037654 RepID=UPI00244DAAB1|nr:substrate-binding domain-containing protein [Methanonatronarchaeum sp. AMET-Sl]WGI17811.1 substrate-binding domain-containing protein [Methanonatronarchaeum sp. AMET-Sl]